MPTAAAGEAPTAAPDPAARSGPGESAGSGDGPADPLQAIIAHLGALLAAGRTRLAIAVDTAALAVDRLLFRLLLILTVVALAFVIACVGGYHLLSGALLGLEILLGHRFAAELLVGALCLGLAVALVAGLLRHLRRDRLARLHRRYGDDAVDA